MPGEEIIIVFTGVHTLCLCTCVCVYTVTQTQEFSSCLQWVFGSSVKDRQSDQTDVGRQTWEPVCLVVC